MEATKCRVCSLIDREQGIISSGSQVDKEDQHTDQERSQPEVAGFVKLTRPIARPKMKAMKSKKLKKPLLANAMQEDLSSRPRLRQIEHLELKKIDKEAWPQFEANRKNFKKAGL